MKTIISTITSVFTANIFRNLQCTRVAIYRLMNGIIINVHWSGIQVKYFCRSHICEHHENGRYLLTFGLGVLYKCPGKTDFYWRFTVALFSCGLKVITIIIQRQKFQYRCMFVMWTVIWQQIE